jgi:hypothetical protein
VDSARHVIAYHLPWIVLAMSLDTTLLKNRDFKMCLMTRRALSISPYSVGPNPDGDPTVGFNVGLFKEGVTAIASAEKCRHISPAALALAAALQAHLRSEGGEGGEGGLPVWVGTDGL